MTVVSIHQPNYLPWAGYFRKLIHSNFFVFFDNVQMPGGKSYIYRTAVNLQGRSHWLSVSTHNKSKFLPINQIRITERQWVKKHIKTLDLNYAFSPWRGLIMERIAPILEKEHNYIVDLNIELIIELLNIMNLNNTTLVRASELKLEKKGVDSIDEILQILNADTYLTGQGRGTARYLDVNHMQKLDINVRYVSNNFPEYSQHNSGFVPGLSIIDIILNCGPERTRDILLGEC